jgi:hypothetical protein
VNLWIGSENEFDFLPTLAELTSKKLETPLPDDVVLDLDFLVGF